MSDTPTPTDPTSAPTVPADAPAAIAGVDPATAAIPAQGEATGQPLGDGIEVPADGTPSPVLEGDGSGSALPPVDGEVDVHSTVDEVPIDDPAPHPEPVAFATVQQDNVTEPGTQHTTSLGLDADGNPSMIRSSHTHETVTETITVDIDDELEDDEADAPAGA